MGKYIQNIAESQDTIAPFSDETAKFFSKSPILDTPWFFIYIDCRELPMKPLHREACLTYVKSDSRKNIKGIKWKETFPTEFKMLSD